MAPAVKKAKINLICGLSRNKTEIITVDANLAHTWRQLLRTRSTLKGLLKEDVRITSPKYSEQPRRGWIADLEGKIGECVKKSKKSGPFTVKVCNLGPVLGAREQTPGPGSGQQNGDRGVSEPYNRIYENPGDTSREEEEEMMHDILGGIGGQVDYSVWAQYARDKVAMMGDRMLLKAREGFLRLKNGNHLAWEKFLEYAPGDLVVLNREMFPDNVST